METTAPWGFSRSSVIDQAAGALREAIRQGEWRETLPGGHQLARQLGVSRPTVQAALARLAAEGRIEIRQGRRTRLKKTRHAPAAAGHPAVCVLCPVSSDSAFFSGHALLLEMHAAFAGLGIRWEVVFDARLGEQRPETRLRQLVAGRPHVCWILFSALESIQEWFASAGVRALVLGSCAPGLTLPSADLNYRAVGWHAAGAAVRHGHRHVALVMPATSLPGDRATREGFRQYLRQRKPVLTITDCNVPEHPAGRKRVLERLLGGPERPTAVVSMRPALTIELGMVALRCGLRIPRDVSIISRDSHPLLDAALPELTRYRSTARKLAGRAVRIAACLLAGRKAPAKPSLVTPAFVAGATLATRVPP